LPSSTDPGERSLLQITLVEAETGLIKVLRALSLGPAQTASLYEAIRRQATLPTEPAEFDRIQRTWQPRDLALQGEQG